MAKPSRIESSLTGAVNEAFELITDFKSQSQKHKGVLRDWLVGQLRNKLDSSYKIKKSTRIKGIIFDRKIDISIIFEKKVIGIFRIKFIYSSHRKNFKNSIASEIGEIANFRSKGIAYGSLIISTHPIHRKDKGKELWDDHFSSDAINYYHELLNSNHDTVKIDAQAICIFNLDKDQESVIGLCEKTDLGHLTESDFDRLEEMKIENFLDDFCDKCNGITGK